MGAGREGVLTTWMDPCGGASGVIDEVRAAFGSETPFPVRGEVGVRLRDGGHGLSGWIGKREGVRGR